MKNPLEADIFRRTSRTQHDLILIFVVAVLVFSLSLIFNLPEVILGFIGRHNELLIGDLLIIGLLLVLSLAFFSYRRWQELADEIQERKETDRALLSANRRLQLLNDITRHDIINSLTGLFLLLSRAEAKAAGNTELLAQIEKEKEIAEIIHRQIVFTRDYQEIGLRMPEWQNVEDVITKAWVGHKIGSVRIDVRVHGLEIFADLLLEKVFYNLIDNAMKYGGPAMTAVRFTMHREGDSVVIACEDDGLGISEEARKNLFHRGYGKHTGYGLFMIREVLGISGLTITENSQPGSGARFEILVPKGLYRCTGPAI